MRRGGENATKSAQEFGNRYFIFLVRRGSSCECNARRAEKYVAPSLALTPPPPPYVTVYINANTTLDVVSLIGINDGSCSISLLNTPGITLYAQLLH